MVGNDDVRVVGASYRVIDVSHEIENLTRRDADKAKNHLPDIDDRARAIQ